MNDKIFSKIKEALEYSKVFCERSEISIVKHPLWDEHITNGVVVLKIKKALELLEEVK